MPICTCSRCSTQKCTDETGHLVPGQFVTQKIQLKHRLIDVQNQQDKSRFEGFLEPDDADDQDLESALRDLEAEKRDLAFEQAQVDGTNSALTLVTPLGIFLSWLHLFCGLSRVKCQMARKFLLQILEIARHNPLLNDMDHRRLPKDIQTIVTDLSIIPELDMKICCPTCFSLYEISNASNICLYKKSPKAKPCGKELFEKKSVYRGLRNMGKTREDSNARRIRRPSEIGCPRNVYATQKLSTWLQWFLNRSIVEEEVENWSDELAKSTKKKMYDIQQSKAWSDIT